MGSLCKFFAAFTLLFPGGACEIGGSRGGGASEKVLEKENKENKIRVNQKKKYQASAS